MHRVRRVVGPVLAVVVLGAAVITADPRGTSAGLASVREVGVGPRGANVLEISGRINQDGENLTYFGYLTYIRRLQTRHVFERPGPRSEETAFLTFYGEAQLRQLTLVGKTFNGISVGDLAIYRRGSPGANFSDPNSFRQGSLVAEFQGRLQDTLATLNADVPSGATDPHAVVDGFGDFRQTTSEVFSADGNNFKIGKEGSRYRFAFQGWGELDDPGPPPQSHIYIGGHAVLP